MIWFFLFFAVVASITIFRSYGFQEWMSLKGWRQSLSASEKRTLEKHFDFYKRLPAHSKKIFEYRVNRFKDITEFIPRKMQSVSEEMEVLISASAVQLTFGYDNVFLDHFERIIVYPDEFFSDAGQRYHKGEVNPRAKAIVLSWKHFVEGYATKEGVNLGLHEMAHALQLENIILNDEYGFMDDGDIRVWQELAAEEIKKIISPEQSFFRDYGGTNQAEFFAVAVENYFERPQEFLEYHEALYRSLCRLLRQDPVILTG
ncbi:MAG: zinc-dependent peptidase [Cyclobacteriaceae bacterium]